MGRPRDTKNNMKSPEEKERLILEHIEQGVTISTILLREKIAPRRYQIWIKKYRLGGLKALESQSNR